MEKPPNHEEEEQEKKSEKIKALPEAVLISLEVMREKVDEMTSKMLYDKLKCFCQDTRGSDSTLRERLKKCYEEIILYDINHALSSELLPYYIIVDFEATCEEVQPPNYMQEIIEFPAVIVDAKNQKIVDCFQMYCKPSLNPKLSKYCTDLTGITQQQVDSAEPFSRVLELFQKWLAKHGLGRKKFEIVTDGPWDMSRFLYTQCLYSNVKFPKWATRWVNIKKAFSKFYKCERVPLKDMLDLLGMEFKGRLHCGLDDAKNIARVLLVMIYDGANIQANERIKVPKKDKEENINKKDCKEVINGSEAISDLNNKMGKLRVEANYSPVYYTGNMPNYWRLCKARAIAEVQLAREILKSSSASWETVAEC